MAHLTRPTKYNIGDSNIALLGSDLERRVREHGGDKEAAWETAGKEAGIQIWRIEQFHVVPWPAERKGSFYDGDSYIILHTYKPDPDSESLSYDLHFWLGQNTTQDEAGTAAYKTVELDDHLHGRPVQYREVQGSESGRFLSYFPHFTSLHGGASTGFHHVASLPPLDVHRLYRISAGPSAASRAVVRQVAPDAASLSAGAVLVLDRGTTVLQLNAQGSAGKAKFAAAEFARQLVDGRTGQCELSVYDEGGPGAGLFLSALGADDFPPGEAPVSPPRPHSVSLFRLSDASGSLSFEAISPPTRDSLASADAFIVDASSHPTSPAVYVWLGSRASLAEKRLALQYAQQYVYDRREGGDPVSATVSIVRMTEGSENEAFADVLGR